MHEAVSRRYGRALETAGVLPDLILLDGGRGQLGAGIKALEALGLDYLPMNCEKTDAHTQKCKPGNILGRLDRQILMYFLLACGI